MEKTDHRKLGEVIFLKATFMCVLGRKIHSSTTWRVFAESRTDQTCLCGCKRSPPTYKIHTVNSSKGI